jgi:Tfp pilus assembly protein PilX
VLLLLLLLLLLTACWSCCCCGAWRGSSWRLRLRQLLVDAAEAALRLACVFVSKASPWWLSSHFEFLSNCVARAATEPSTLTKASSNPCDMMNLA